MSNQPMRTSTQKINTTLKKQITKSLNQVLLDMKKPQEIATFLEDFLTDAEYEVFAKRLAVAYWLKKGRSYQNIKTNLKVSSATIASVQSMIETKGFSLALKKLEAEEWASQWAQKISKLKVF